MSDTPGIAIIDEGIDVNDPALRSCTIAGETIIHLSTPDADSPSRDGQHGTNIAKIIHHLSPRTKIIPVSLRSPRRIDTPLLIEALRYCATRDDIDIINISLGFLSDTAPTDIWQACKLCLEKNKFIVAAAHYDIERECYPAAYPLVFGVGTGITTSASSFCYQGDGYINILAKGIHQRMIGEDGKPTIRSGTSYATACFSAIIANILDEHPSLSYRELIDVLMLRSITMPTTHYPMGGIGKNPDLSDMLNASGKLMLFAVDDPEIQLLWSDPRAQVMMSYPFDPGQQFFKLTAEPAANTGKKLIPGVLSPRLASVVDTLVVGNFFRNPNIINYYFAYNLIDFAHQHGVKIVATDHYLAEIVATRAMRSAVVHH